MTNYKFDHDWFFGFYPWCSLKRSRFDFRWRRRWRQPWLEPWCRNQQVSVWGWIFHHWRPSWSRRKSELWRGLPWRPWRWGGRYAELRAPRFCSYSLESIIYFYPEFDRKDNLLPDVVVGIRDGEKWEQDGHRAPVNNLPQVADNHYYY